MPIIEIFYRSLWIGLVSLLIVSCGGGGGSDLTIEAPEEPLLVAVTINEPSAEQLDHPEELTLSGTAENATSVFVSFNGASEIEATGVENWSVLVDASLLPAGDYSISARAVGVDSEANATISVTLVREVVEPPIGDNPDPVEFTYFSSVDGASLGGNIYNEFASDSSSEGAPLLVFLHGANGRGTIRDSIVEEAIQRGWLAMAPNGRAWGLVDEGCPWEFSVSYFDSDDPDVGPGEQDILDAIDWVQQNYNVDASRIYLTGFSFGGRGAYILALKNPGTFAAVGALGPLTDAFDDIIRLPNPPECKQPITNGLPGDSDRVDASFKATSARFLIENAYNEPIYHAHGTEDRVTRNIIDTTGYQHGFDLTIDNTFSGCYGTTDICFEHTPTLSELKDAFPGGYDWAYMFTDIAHLVDDQWITGTPQDDTNQGIVNPNNGQLLGMMDFLEARSLGETPETVVFKTYEDQHELAYWLRLESSVAWTQMPAMVVATRDTNANSVEASISRAEAVGIDLNEAELDIDSPLTIVLSELIEPVFDPEVAMSETESQSVILRLLGSISANETREVLVDSETLSDEFINIQNGLITLGPIEVDGEVVIEVR